MKVLTKKVKLEDGSYARKPVDMYRRLNLNILRLLNKTQHVGKYQMPLITCATKIQPDFFALYREKGLYSHTQLIGVCFYSNDIEFDGEDGLYNAIYYGKSKRLQWFKKRFRGVKFLVTPDYSVFGDINPIIDLYRVLMTRVVALWFIFELQVVVIPNISYTNECDFEDYFNGLETCSVIAFNAKGHIRYNSERRLFKSAIKYAVDHLPLKTILVYSACGKDETCLKVFKYAIDKGVDVRIINNTIRERNILRRAQ